MLFNCNHRKTNPEGNDAIFGIVTDELNFLSHNGVPANLNGKKITVYFALGLLLGDHEALNSASGFMEGANATHYCMICKMSKAENRQNLHIREKMLRTPEQYESDGFDNKKNGSKRKHNLESSLSISHC